MKLALHVDYKIIFFLILGCGEHLVRTFLAKECGKALGKSSSDLALQNLQKVMKEKFAESEFLSGVPEKLGGAICLQVGFF